MTPMLLLEQLKLFTEGETAELLLPANVPPDGGARKIRPPGVHLMRLPNRDAETALAPYLLHQFIKGEDTQAPGEPMRSRSFVRTVFTVFDEDGGEGARNLLNVMTRLRIALLRAGQIGDQFVLRPPLEMIIYTDNAPPFFMGEMMTAWDMPPIESEVPDQWR